jgi:hypothetical protein
MPGRTIMSPQMAGGPSVTTTSTNRPACTITDVCSEPTTAEPARPSTRTITVWPASASASRIVAVSVPDVSGRGGLGSVPVGNAVFPSEVNPDSPSVVSCSEGS